MSDQPPRARTGQKIATLYAWVATEPDGGEGVCGMSMPDGSMWPMVGADRTRMENLREFAQRTHDATGYPVRLKMFGAGVTIDTIA